MDNDLLQLAAIIARKRRGLSDYRIAAACADLARVSGQLHRLAEHECNYCLTPRQEKRRERLEAKAREIAKGWRVPIEFQGDPRGRPIILDLGGPSNSWGGGWGV